MQKNPKKVRRTFLSSENALVDSDDWFINERLRVGGGVRKQVCFVSWMKHCALRAHHIDILPPKFDEAQPQL
jgi:hypothetical protein